MSGKTRHDESGELRMFSVSIPVEPADHERIVAGLWEAGTLGIVEGDGVVEAFFDNTEAAAGFGIPKEAPSVDWVQQTEDAWPPLLVGEKFFVVAPWRTEPTPPDRFRLEINPGQQCGTGQHPCTQLCLEAMERLIHPGDSVLDVGTGSGILSIAAKMLGAGRIVACDIDPDAAHAAPFFIGSVDAVSTNSFDVVVANISEIVIGELREEFHRVAKHRILSGFQDQHGNWTCVVE
jgi:ribosomal protein L11 methyltransferase